MEQTGLAILAAVCGSVTSFVSGTKIGRWPVAEVPVKLSESPAFAGGRIDRGAPCYGEDNEYVYGELLGMTKREIADLAAEGVF